MLPRSQMVHLRPFNCAQRRNSQKLKLDQGLLIYQLAIRAKGGVRNTQSWEPETQDVKELEKYKFIGVLKKMIGCQKRSNQ